MTDVFDPDTHLPVLCPNCGYDMSRSIEEMENTPRLQCPNCEKEVVIDLDELEQTLHDMEEEWLGFVDVLETD